MRIAILNEFNTIVGGAEQYLAASIPRLAAEGHEVKLWVARNAACDDGSRSKIECDTQMIPWRMEDGQEPNAQGFDSWAPDVFCVHSPLDSRLERFLLSRYPGIFFGHAYALTCISGGKTLHTPSPRPCSRRLGPACLLHYYPHRCGGLSPITMMRDYSRNIARRQRLLKYVAIVTFSSHMRDEYERHVVERGKVKLIRPLCPDLTPAMRDGRTLENTQSRVQVTDQTSPLTIGFLGRLERQKGADILLHSLPHVAKQLHRDLTVFISGQGSERTHLLSLAEKIMRDAPAIRVRFQDWITSDRLDDFYARVSLIVVPSVWPEPFGLVGLEASSRGVPTAAFAVGGIPDWLIDGRNGHLAPGDPPTARGLADAIARCLAHPHHHAQLRQGAFEVAAGFSAEQHIGSLLGVLRNAAKSVPAVAHEPVAKLGF